MELQTKLQWYPLVTLKTPLKVTVTKNNPPFFRPNLSEIIAIHMTNSPLLWQLKLPAIVDDDVGDIVTMTFERGNANFINITIAKDYLEIGDLSKIK
jgi:hypothetical protein